MVPLTRFSLSGAVVAAAVVWTPLASAQPTDAQRALATELFKEGRALMNEKKFADACPKLEESQRLDPGGGTLLNVAICHEGLGKLATAWSEFEEAAAIAQRDKRADREKLATDRAAKLQPRLMRLTIRVAPESEVPDLAITRNAVAVPRAAWGMAMPLDAGDYTIEARAPGRAAWMSMVRVSVEGAQLTLDIPALAPLPEPPPAAVRPAGPPPEPIVRYLPAPQPPQQLPKPDRTPWLVSGGVIGGVGSLGLALGGIAGGLASSRASSLDERCEPGEPKRCPAEAAGTIADMQTFAKASTGLLIVGGVFTAGGAALLALGFTLDDKVVARVGLAPGPGLTVGVSVP